MYTEYSSSPSEVTIASYSTDVTNVTNVTDVTHADQYVFKRDELLDLLLFAMLSARFADSKSDEFKAMKKKMNDPELSLIEFDIVMMSDTIKPCHLAPLLASLAAARGA